VDTLIHAAVVAALGATAALHGGPGWLGPLAAGGVMASAVAEKLSPPPDARETMGGLLASLGKRDGYYAMLLVAILTLALAPAWLPSFMGLVAAGTHAYWVGRLLYRLRKTERNPK
jgi:hypothetical protein